MPIKKQEFYEGAALHIIARAGGPLDIRYDAPFFLLNNGLAVLLKYSTKGRSPWGFTFTIDEQRVLRQKAAELKTAIGLICGADGVAAFEYELYASISGARNAAVHIACYRNHGEYYEVKGPEGVSDRKIAPSNWQRIIEVLGSGR